MNKVQKPYKKHSYFSKKNSDSAKDMNVNLKGFICSCNFREKDCLKESYNLLNQYADQLWPPAEEPSPTDAESKGNVENVLDQEIKLLRSKKKRFEGINSGAKNFLFVKTTVPDPVKLAETILANIYETKSQQSKFLLRLLPIETTCKAYVKDIVAAFEPLCEKHFSNEAKSFAIVFNHRNNSSVSRDEVIKEVADLVMKHGEEKKLEHKVDLKNADLAIVIEIIRGFAFIGVAPNFFKYKKYNLLAFGGGEADSKPASEEKAEPPAKIDDEEENA